MGHNRLGGEFGPDTHDGRVGRSSWAYQVWPGPEISWESDDLSGIVPRMALPDFTLDDQARQPWRLADHLDAGVLLVFLRGDW